MNEVESVIGSAVSSTVGSAVSGIGSAVVGYVVAGVAVVVTVLGGWIYMLKADVALLTTQVNEQKAIVALKEAQINSFEGAIKNQNEKIDKMAVDMNASTERLAAQSKMVETRYSVVPVTDKTCEGKVAAYEAMLGVFNKRGK